MWSDPEDKTATQETRHTVSRLNRVEGIDCERAELLISRHLDRELDLADTALLEKHLKNCAYCRAHLSEWTTQSNMITAELDSLWQKTHKTSTAQTQRPKVSRFRRCMWVPLGMAASQVLALIGLTIYFLFFTSPVQAPRTSSPELKHDKQTSPASAVVAASKVERPEIADDTQNLTVEIETTPAVPSAPIAIMPNPTNQKAPVIKQNTTERIVFASPMTSAPLREVQHLSVQYSISANADGTVKDESGIIRILGDVLSDHCIVRICSNHGERTDVAIGDIDTLLNPAQRSIVRRLIDACSKPEMRKRFAAHPAK